MARKNAARERALAAAKTQRRREGQKLSRLRQAGVDVTSLDQRVSNEQLAGMSTREIRAQVTRGQRFVDRSNSYVAGVKGTPLSGATWAQYQRAEKQYNAQSDAFYASIKDLRIPTINQTVGGYLANLASGDLSRGMNPHRLGDYKSYGNLVRKASNITDQDSLKQLLENMENRASSSYLAQEAQSQRNILYKMLSKLGKDDMIADIHGMSDTDVITLSQYSEFMPTLEGMYAISKSTNEDTPRWQSSVLEDSEQTIDDLVQWAKRNFERSEAEPEQKKSEQDADAQTSTGPRRDRYGRYVARDRDNAAPVFNRDAQGRFAAKPK